MSALMTNLGLKKLCSALTPYLGASSVPIPPFSNPSDNFNSRAPANMAKAKPSASKDKGERHAPEKAKLAETNGVKKPKGAKKVDKEKKPAVTKALEDFLSASDNDGSPKPANVAEETTKSTNVAEKTSKSTDIVQKTSEKTPKKMSKAKLAAKAMEESIEATMSGVIREGVAEATSRNNAATTEDIYRIVEERLREIHANPPDLVEFAFPLVKRKNELPVLAKIIEAEKNRAVRRGVKEVTKEVGRFPTTGYDNESATMWVPAVVIIAGDIHPSDVIAPIPILCESKSIDYIFVRSRILLGLCGATKRPTSVVMIMKARKAPKEKKVDPDNKDGDGKYKKFERDEAPADEASQKVWDESFDDLAKLARKLRSKIPPPVII